MHARLLAHRNLRSPSSTLPLTPRTALIGSAARQPVFHNTRIALAYLGEANVGRLLTEALTADVQAVLADETGLVSADTAAVLLALSSMLPFYPVQPMFPLPSFRIPSLTDTISFQMMLTYQPREPLP